jgi:hypothetical protein
MTNPQTDENERVARAIEDAADPGTYLSIDALDRITRAAIAAMDTRRETEVLREALRECQMEARIGSTTIWQSIERITSAVLTNTLTVVGDGQ